METHQGMVRNQGCLEGLHQEWQQGELTAAPAACITSAAQGNLGDFILIKIFSYF